jgi:hypothetical protein
LDLESVVYWQVWWCGLSRELIVRLYLDLHEVCCFHAGIVGERVGLLWGKGEKGCACANPTDLTNMVAKCECPAKVNEELLKAIDLVLSGEWNAAHQIVQQYEDTTAAWIHAVLHKIEGDQDNSRYWYRRAGKLKHVSDEPKAELAEIRKGVAGQK